MIVVRNDSKCAHRCTHVASAAEEGESSSTSTLSFRESGSSERAELRFDRPLVADLTLCASARSSADTSPKPDVDPRGLSADLPPGIFVRSEFLNERIDSFVSDLLKEGYESRLGPGPVGV